MENRIYKYRIYPSKKQKLKLTQQLDICKNLYNQFIKIILDTYKESKIALKKFDLDKIIPKDIKEVHSQVLQNVSNRVHKSFQNFFRGVKNPLYKKKGFPRFKSPVKSITYPQSGFKFISEKKLYISKVGNVPIILHREIKGKIKTLTIKKNSGDQWFACFCCEIEKQKMLDIPKEKTGIDVGIEYFVTFSNGKTISNPRFLIKSENKIRILHRLLSRKKKYSRNRIKAKIKIAKQYIKITNQRNDFLHKLSHNITETYNFIAVEDLNIQNMLKNQHLAKHITDASWNRFIQMLSYKAVASGGQLKKNAKTKGSSKRCSNCGTEINMPLSKRQFDCSNCGNVLNRDHNSAINHLKDTVGQTGINACGDCIKPLETKVVIEETGTIYQNYSD